MWPNSMWVYVTHILATLYLCYEGQSTQRDSFCISTTTTIIIIINSLSSEQNYLMYFLVYYIMNFY